MHEEIKIPPITIANIRNNVHKKLKSKKACDIYKLTAEHLKHAGDETLEHLCTLINRIIENMEYLEAPELKVAIASVIHKGKDKPKTHRKSYRLVRVCPLIVRLIDEYIRPIATELSLQSINQYGFSEDIMYLIGALQRHEAQSIVLITRKLSLDVPWTAILPLKLFVEKYKKDNCILLGNQANSQLTTQTHIKTQKPE